MGATSPCSNWPLSVIFAVRCVVECVVTWVLEGFGETFSADLIVLNGCKKITATESEQLKYK